MRALVKAGAKVAASNNAGDRAWHWAVNMGHDEVAKLLVEVGEGKKGGGEGSYVFFIPPRSNLPPPPFYLLAGVAHRPGRRHRAGPRAQS